MITNSHKTAVFTKALPATDTKGAGIKVWAPGESSRYYPMRHGQPECHAIAAEDYMTNLNWFGDYVQAATQDGYVFVPVPR